MFHVVLPISPYILEILFLKDNISVHPWLQQYSSSPQSLGFESRIACSFSCGLAPRCATPPSDFSFQKQISKNKKIITLRIGCDDYLIFYHA